MTTEARQAPRPGKTRILVAEDSPTQAEQIRMALEDHGYEVEVGRNGRIALEMAEKFLPVLIISDIVMPEMDGYELCRRVKTSPTLKDTPVMLLTSLSDPVDVMRGLECQADNFLVKPYEERYLISRISFILANRHLREHDYAQMGVDIHFAGNRYFITSDRMQILNLLLSTYETAVEKNRELLETQRELKSLAETLDEKVQERTAQLQAEVDERRRAEAALQRMIERERSLSEQLQQARKMEAIGRLAGGVAHDFNNMLTVINGCTELLLEKAADDESQRELLKEVAESGQRAVALTGQLLAFSRKAIIKPEPIDLNALIRQFEKMLRRLLRDDITFTFVPGADLRLANADPSHVEQIIMNLVVNARDAMPKGGNLIVQTENVELDEPYVEKHVEVTPGSYVLLSVSDNGIGMSEETKSRIFEPFFTTKGIGKGTGLGLATIYGAVKQGGGHVTVYSEVGRGTTFKVYLPVAEAGARLMEAAPDKPTSPVGTETVLLVEDDDSVRRLTRIALEANGYHVVEANSGAAAIEVALKHTDPIQLLLTDVVMPELGGQEIVGAISEAHPETRVLFMSGYTDDAIVRYGVLSAETPFLQKPFTPSVLARAVREVLDKQ